MEIKKQTIDELMDSLFKYMEDIQRSEATIVRYQRKWQKVKDFMLDHKIRYYDTSVEKSYLNSILGVYKYNQLKFKEKELVNAIEALSEFQETGRILMGPRKQKPKKFTGKIGEIITKFIEFREKSLNLSKRTIQFYRIYLYSFYSYLNKIGIKDLNKLQVSDLFSFIEQIDPNTPAKRHVTLNILKIFFRYLYEYQILSIDYSQVIPKDNYKNQPKLPSTFTDEEIASLLKAVDRGSPKGKRDYAILLLATKLGLRASDICELKFENIIWENSVITLNQYKTGKRLELPLLPEIGNAIIDYLKYARPISQESNCFIHVQSPYDRIHTSDIGNLVRKYITLAGINYSNRKHGPHSLRHCFVSALLKENIPLPIISEALGHKNLASSLFYLRIDNKSLRKCALDVPPVPSTFYEQEGGNCHD